jgi:hypothetical protein
MRIVMRSVVGEDDRPAVHDVRSASLIVLGPTARLRDEYVCRVCIRIVSP